MRKHQAEKRDVLPDPLYNSKLVTRAINKIMLDGKKGIAQTILYDAFNKIKEKTGLDPKEVFEKAIDNIKPYLELKVRRIGGANYQVPIEVSNERKITLSLRWLINYSRLRNEKEMVDRLANEIIDASNGIGGSVKKREDIHKMAEANKAFAHYRW
ncbi:30S ribosomal protein S7 [Spiroplasma endosymbiont of Aspidapion aeneum]|uniref:30S ribosomal protein S7 n=1 Tax=Spiroplasma endosymbiont of Aspidapion aeneum TaxID=3066276 RepID=UPI00313F335C